MQVRRVTERRSKVGVQFAVPSRDSPCRNTPSEDCRHLFYHPQRARPRSTSVSRHHQLDVGPESGVQDRRLYRARGYRARDLHHARDVGMATTWSYPNAVAGRQYCFAVSAYFAGPVEGPRSEVCGFSNAPPTLVNPGAQRSTIGQADSLQLAGSDPKGDPLTYSATGLPPGLKLMASTGYISGTPTTAGSYSLTARAFDGVLTASQTFTWTVGVADTTPPVVNITSPTSAATYATGAARLALGGTASDADGVTQVTWGEQSRRKRHCYWNGVLGPCPRLRCRPGATC